MLTLSRMSLDWLTQPQVSLISLLQGKLFHALEFLNALHKIISLLKHLLVPLLHIALHLLQLLLQLFILLLQIIGILQLRQAVFLVQVDGTSQKFATSCPRRVKRDSFGGTRRLLCILSLELSQHALRTRTLQAHLIAVTDDQLRETTSRRGCTRLVLVKNVVTATRDSLIAICLCLDLV